MTEMLRIEKTGPLAEQLLEMLEAGDLGGAARTITESAMMLMDACDSGRYAPALEANLRMWVALRTVVDNTGSMSAGLAEQLRRLAAYVVNRTMAVGDGQLSAETLSSLIGINLQIAGGLVESSRQQAIRERAYEIWEDQGRPDGGSEAHWFQAERELFGG